MQVRHLVARDNVDASGRVLDATGVRHGSLRAGRVWALAGPIDADTHLNLDFGDHQLAECVVVEALTVGAPAIPEVTALPVEGAFSHRGLVDVGARRAAWLAALHERRRAVAQARGERSRSLPSAREPDP